MFLSLSCCLPSQKNMIISRLHKKPMPTTKPRWRAQWRCPWPWSRWLLRVVPGDLMGIGAYQIGMEIKQVWNHQPGISCILLCLSELSFGKYVYFACFMKKTCYELPCIYIADSTTSQIPRLWAITLVFFSRNKMPWSSSLWWSLGGDVHPMEGSQRSNGGIPIWVFGWRMDSAMASLRIFVGHVVQQRQYPAREAAVDQQTRDT